MTNTFPLLVLILMFILKPSGYSYTERSSFYIFNAVLMPLPSLAYTAFYVLQDQTYNDDDSENEVDAPFYNHVTTTTEMTNESEEALRKRIWMECLDQTRVDPELVIRLKFGRKNAFTNRKELKQWTLCVLSKKGLMSEQGVFYMDAARKRLRSEDIVLAEKVIDECLSKKALPPEEIAWSYLKCHFKKRNENLTKIGLF